MFSMSALPAEEIVVLQKAPVTGRRKRDIVKFLASFRGFWDPHKQPPLQLLSKECRSPWRHLAIGEGLQEGGKALLVSHLVPFGTQDPTLF